MEEQRMAEDQAYQDMLEIAEALNTNSKTEESLYLYVKKLFFLYKTEGKVTLAYRNQITVPLHNSISGDEYAKSLLSQYTTLIQQETEAGNISESVQDDIYSIPLTKILKDHSPTI